MVKFYLTLKDDFSDVTLEGDSEKEVLDNLKSLRSLKEKSDKALGYDIKIPEYALKKMKDAEYSDRVMIMLYFADRELTRQELHDRNIQMKIRESWWVGSNFTRDLRKKISASLLTASKEKKPSYNLTQKGISHVKKIINEEEE